MFFALRKMLKQTVNDWLDDSAPMHGAALAFYSLLSIAPLLVVAIAVAGFVYGEEAARGELDTQIRGLVGKEGAEAVQELLAHAQQPTQGILATVIGLATLLVGASGVFGQLQMSLNAIWEVRPKPGGGIWSFLQTRLLSFTMVLGIGFLLLMSLILSAILAGVAGYVQQFFPGGGWVTQGANVVVSLAVITLLFAMIFRLLPDAKIAWKDVWAGAALTALMFTVGKFGIGEYLGRASVGSSYGAAGSLVVLILWVYYSSQILLFGAEFTQVYARQTGSPIEPAEYAEHVTCDEMRTVEPVTASTGVAPDRLVPRHSRAIHSTGKPR